MWQRVEVMDPVLRTRKQGRPKDNYLMIDDTPYEIMRVISPTVAYVTPMGGFQWWSIMKEDHRLSTVDWIKKEE